MLRTIRDITEADLRGACTIREAVYLRKPENTEAWRGVLNDFAEETRSQKNHSWTGYQEAAFRRFCTAIRDRLEEIDERETGLVKREAQASEEGNLTRIAEALERIADVLEWYQDTEEGQK